MRRALSERESSAWVVRGGSWSGVLASNERVPCFLRMFRRDYGR